MKLRILETLASADPASGGPLEGLLRHAEVWRAQGHECELVTLDSPDAPYLANMPIKVHAMGGALQSLPAKLRRVIPPARYGFTSHYVPWLKKNAASYNAVIVNGLWNYSVTGARMALTGGKTPYFVFSHGMMDPWFKRSNPAKHAAKQLLWWMNEGPLANNARAVLFTTEEEREVCRNVFTPYNIREAVVGYGTADVGGDPASQIKGFRERVPGLGERRFLLYLSRIHPKKGCDLLIEAFAVTAAAHPDVDLVIGGPDETGWRGELEAIAAKAGVSHRIFWPGMLSGNAKWGAFRACDAFILPSHQENFGVVVAEALACERPVLISDKVNIWREIDASGAGFVEGDTREGTIRLIERFHAAGPAMIDAMGQIGRKLFLERYTIEGAAETLLNVIGKEIAAHVSA